MGDPTRSQLKSFEDMEAEAENATVVAEVVTVVPAVEVADVVTPEPEA
jgi:hypothetical protein